MTYDVVLPGCGWILWCVTCVCLCRRCGAFYVLPTRLLLLLMECLQSNGFEVLMMVIAEP